MAFQKITESESLYDNLDQMSVRELLEGVNNEDRKVAIVVGREIPKIEKLVTRIVERMRRGGRLFYIGAGTSGRLGVLDASEIPPTYGMPNTLVIGLIAGGDRALRNPVESAEDDLNKAWEEHPSTEEEIRSVTTYLKPEYACKLSAITLENFVDTMILYLPEYYAQVYKRFKKRYLEFGRCI